MADLEATLFRVWRNRLGITQSEAAKRLGYGISEIAEYDRGERRPRLVVRYAMSAIAAEMKPFSLEDAA